MDSPKPERSMEEAMEAASEVADKLPKSLHYCRPTPSDETLERIVEVRDKLKARADKWKDARQKKSEYWPQSIMLAHETEAQLALYWLNEALGEE